MSKRHTLKRKTFRSWKYGNKEWLIKIQTKTVKLTIVTGKWFKTKKEEQIYKFRELNEVEDKTRFLSYCRNYKEGLIDYLISTENINLTFGNKLEKLKLLFVSGSWGSFNALGKFVPEACKIWEQNLTQ